MKKPPFLTGMELARRFYLEAVRPLLSEAFPALRHSAGLIDYGSDVLGFDDAVSVDHQWGPRLSLFLTPGDLTRHGADLDALLSRRLPRRFLGWSTNFSGSRADFIRWMEQREDGEVGHLIRIHTPEEFFQQHLAWDFRSAPTTADWLRFPQQRLMTVRKGQLFHDDLGLASVQQILAFYPDPVWLYLMSAEWRAVSDEEAFVGRCGQVGDEVGSSLVAARQVEHLMRLAFLQRKQYFPYSKWFGTAFARLEGIRPLQRLLKKVLKARTWKERERWLGRAYVMVAEEHNRLGCTEPVEAKLSLYYDRPFWVLFAQRFETALTAQVHEPLLRQAGALGSIDQVTQRTTLLERVEQIRDRVQLIERTAE